MLNADLMWQGAFELISRRIIPESTVLKVGHHGSISSTTNEFLDITGPQIALISIGSDNYYGHPNPDVVKRLEDKLGAENIFMTNDEGVIEFITDGESLWVKVKE